LTIAVDEATRSVVAAVLREEGTKAVDACLLLAQMAVPIRLAWLALPCDWPTRPSPTTGC
jgi:hypothetical protein